MDGRKFRRRPVKYAACWIRYGNSVVAHAGYDAETPSSSHAGYDAARDDLGAFASNTTGELNILGHDRDSLGVNRAQIRVLEKTHQISLRRFLKSSDGGRLEPQVGFKILSNFPNEPLEGKFADQQLRRLLVPSDFSESDGPGPVTMRFLDAAGGGRALPGGLGGQLFPRSFSSGRLASRLLCTSHFSAKGFFRR